MSVKLKKHRKSMIKIFFSMTLILCCTGMVSLTVFAAQQEHTVTLPIRQIFTAESEADGTFYYELTALEADAPTPSGSENGIYRVAMTGNTEETLYMTYDHASDYRYQVKQIVAESQKGYTYDDQTYTIVIRIKNTADGGLESELYISGNGGKTEGVCFENRYQADEPTLSPDPEPSPNPNPPQTGDTSNPILWRTLFYVSLLGMAYLLLVLLKRRKENTTNEE